jgi:FkbM family methyltransferase
MNFFNLLLFKRIYQKLTGVFYTISYAQTGEDIIIDFLIRARKVKNFTYLDIGANHPVKLNNTYKFYEQGYYGVCVEPDPHLYTNLVAKRKGDTCLNIGIAGIAKNAADFYVMENPLLNTFSKEEAEMTEREQHSKIKRMIQVPLKTVEKIIDTHFAGKAPVFINLDVEGLDEEIIQGFPFQKYRPSIFCIETVHCTSNATSEKRIEIMELMKSKGYVVFADTYVNTIFIDAGF